MQCCFSFPPLRFRHVSNMILKLKTFLQLWRQLSHSLSQFYGTKARRMMWMQESSGTQTSERGYSYSSHGNLLSIFSIYSIILSLWVVITQNWLIIGSSEFCPFYLKRWTRLLYFNLQPIWIHHPLQPHVSGNTIDERSEHGQPEYRCQNSQSIISRNIWWIGRHLN